MSQQLNCVIIVARPFSLKKINIIFMIFGNMHVLFQVYQYSISFIALASPTISFMITCLIRLSTISVHKHQHMFQCVSKIMPWYWHYIICSSLFANDDSIPTVVDNTKWICMVSSLVQIIHISVSRPDSPIPCCHCAAPGFGNEAGRSAVIPVIYKLYGIVLYTVYSMILHPQATFNNME